MDTRIPRESTKPQHEDPASTVAMFARLERRLERLERLIDHGIGAFLNARFPYGRGTDRWARRR